MEPPSSLQLLLPTKSAQWILWLSLILSASLCSLLLWLQVDTILPKELAGKLSILLLAAIPLLVGSFSILFVVVRYVRELEAKVNKSMWDTTP